MNKLIIPIIVAVIIATGIGAFGFAETCIF